MRADKALERAEYPIPAVFTWDGTTTEWWQEHTDHDSGKELWEAMEASVGDVGREAPVVTSQAWSQIGLQEAYRRLHYTRWLYGHDGSGVDRETVTDRIAADLRRCQVDFWHWLDHYGWLETTHDVHREAPFVTFPMQRAMLWHAQELLSTSTQEHREKAVWVKARNVGATWSLSHWLHWRWLFERQSSAKVGSRRGSEVDRGGGDTESVFGKLRHIWRAQHQHLRPDAPYLDHRINHVGIDDPVTNEHVHAVRWRLLNKAMRSRVLGETATGSFGRSGRAQVIVWDEFADLDPRIQEESRAATTSVSLLQILLSTPQGRGNRFHLEAKQSPEYQVLVMPWTVDPRRDNDWYDGLLVENGGDLVRDEREQEYNCSFRGLATAQIWIVTESQLYEDDDLPELARSAFAKSAGFDPGSGPSPAACTIGMLDWEAAKPHGDLKLPRIWVDWSQTWTRTAAGHVAQEVLREWDSTYQGRLVAWADPAVKAVGPNQESWLDLLTQAGLPVQPVGHEELTHDQITAWLDTMQAMHSMGLIRYHRERAQIAYEAAEAWRWNVPKGVRLELLSRESIKWSKDWPSHVSEASMYMVIGAVMSMQPMIPKARDAQEAQAPPVEMEPDGARGVLSRI